MNKRNCNRCKLIFDENVDNFSQCKYKNGNFYFKSICRVCERAATSIYNKKNKDKVRLNQQNFNNKNPEYCKKWKKENRSRINEQEKFRRKNDINFKLKKNVSRAIGKALFSRKLNKNKQSTLKHLPYTMEELKKHIEKQFDSKMSWSNYGIYWHIDHITPHSDFPYISMEEDNFKICWALNNLRPLEAKQNMLDGSTRIRHKI